MSGHRSSGTTRRRVIVAAGGAILAALGGCTRLSEFVADRVTGEVNVFNTLDRRVTGSLTLVDPEGESLLDERLDLAPGSGNGDADGEREPAAIYEDVLTTAGTYQLSLEVAATETTPRRTASESLRIDDPAAEQVVVLIGREVTDELVSVAAIEDFADLEDELEA